jgi:hypothetical protein
MFVAAGCEVMNVLARARIVNPHGGRVENCQDEQVHVFSLIAFRKQVLP